MRVNPLHGLRSVTTDNALVKRRTALCIGSQHLSRSLLCLFLCVPLGTSVEETEQVGRNRGCSGTSMLMEELALTRSVFCETRSYCVCKFRSEAMPSMTSIFLIRKRDMGLLKGTKSPYSKM